MITAAELRTGNILKGDPISIPKIGIHTNALLLNRDPNQLELCGEHCEPFSLTP